MKILFVNHVKDLDGGAERALLNLCTLLKQRGHSPYVLSMHGDGLLYEALCREGIPVLVLPYRQWRKTKKPYYKWLIHRVLWFGYWKRRTALSAKKVAAYVQQEGIEVIHSNTSIVNIGMLAARYSGVAHVWHLREFGKQDFQLGFYERTAYRQMNRWTDRFICISGALSRYYTRLDEEKKRLINDGIPATYYRERKDRTGAKQTVHFLISGRLCPAKGQTQAIAACGILHKRGIRNFDLSIAGTGENYFTVPKELADTVHLLGWVADMAALRESMDAELVCSKAEAFGLVTAEAMLAGLPVIGSNTGGTPELIRDGENGYLYDYPDPEALADKMQRLITDDALRCRMGLTAQCFAQKQFTIERCVQELEAVYEACVKER